MSQGDLSQLGAIQDSCRAAGGGERQLNTISLLLATAVSGAAALAAWRARTLTVGGAAAAWSVGIPVLYGTGWKGGAVLAAFFISSNLISRILSPRPPPGLDPKGNQRDVGQVYANGAAAAVGGTVGLLDAGLGLWLVTTSLAAAAADTWATSVGCWSGVPPRLVWSRKVVPVGTSGGITAAGTAGAVAGALIVAGTGAVASGISILLPAATLIGFLGMVADSSMGSLIQGRFRCGVCNTASEWRVHHCGAATRREGGLAWLNNDGVNFLATIWAAGAALAMWYWLGPS